MLIIEAFSYSNDTNMSDKILICIDEDHQSDSDTHANVPRQNTKVVKLQSLNNVMGDVHDVLQN